MTTTPISPLYEAITTAMSSIHDSIESRADARTARMQALASISQVPLVKQAFDTRRINPDTDFNPRRNLQHYQRSEPFVSEAAANQLKTFYKLKTAIDDIKSDFLGDPDWLDSKARILSNALDRTLRSDQNDGDFSQQNMDYLSELLYLRYRLASSDIDQMNEQQIKNAVLTKDDRLFLKQSLERVEKTSIPEASTKIVKNVATRTTLESDATRTTLESDASPSDNNSSDKKTINLTINM
jgi:hypothetical protein